MSVQNLPTSVFGKGCFQITRSFVLSISGTAINEATAFRNGENGPTCIRQILAEAAYLVAIPCGALETLARAVCAAVFIPILGAIYFIGSCCCKSRKVKEFVKTEIEFQLVSTLITGACTIDAAICLWTNPCKAEKISLMVYNKLKAFWEKPRFFRS
jgi:hypothetical protein